MRQRETFNIPNSITFLGLFASFAIIVLREFWGWTGWIMFGLLVFIIMTDILDGILARWLGQTTVFGAAIDRFRDKFFITGCDYSMLFYVLDSKNGWLDILISIFIFGVIVAEILLFIAGIIGVTKKKRVQANWWGKFKMGFECAAVLIWSINLDLLGNQVLPTGWAILLLITATAACILSFASLGSYITDYYKE